jgi:hypothetical protein
MRAKAKFNRQLKSISIGYVSDTITVKEIENIPNLAEIVYSELLDAVREAIKKKKKIAILFDINNSGNIHELENKLWPTALEAAVKYFEVKEKYEKCAEITTLIGEINEGLKQDNTSDKQPAKRKNQRKSKIKKSDNGK